MHQGLRAADGARAHSSSGREALAALRAWTQRELAVPELYVLKQSGELEERFLDVAAAWPGGGRWLLDVTVRSPFTKQERTKTRQVPGHAAALGERDKATHYGGAVQCLAWETRGRLGREGQQTLAQLAREAAELGKLQQGQAKPRRLHLPTLRAEVEAVLMEAQATRALAALGCRAVAALGWQSARAAAPAGAAAAAA